MTKFRGKVYDFVRTIPKGKTVTYKEVAVAIGYPKACRAVGNALNHNPFVGKIPCHRVIRSNGDLGGYVLGAKKKIQLLLSEKIEIPGLKARALSGLLLISEILIRK